MKHGTKERPWHRQMAVNTAGRMPSGGVTNPADDDEPVVYTYERIGDMAKNIAKRALAIAAPYAAAVLARLGLEVTAQEADPAAQAVVEAVLSESGVETVVAPFDQPHGGDYDLIMVAHDGSIIARQAPGQPQYLGAPLVVGDVPIERVRIVDPDLRIGGDVARDLHQGRNHRDHVLAALLDLPRVSKACVVLVKETTSPVSRFASFEKSPRLSARII